MVIATRRNRLQTTKLISTIKQCHQGSTPYDRLSRVCRATETNTRRKRRGQRQTQHSMMTKTKIVKGPRNSSVLLILWVHLCYVIFTVTQIADAFSSSPPITRYQPNSLLTNLQLFSSSKLHSTTEATNSETAKTSSSITPSWLPSKEFSNVEGYGKVGQEIADIQTIEDALNVADQFWLPCDSNLPSHFRKQVVHHQKRQRWASQLLEKLAHLCISSSVRRGVEIGSRSTLLVDDERLIRLVLASAMPSEEQEDVLSKEGKWIQTSLINIYTTIAWSSWWQRNIKNDDDDDENNDNDVATLENRDDNNVNRSLMYGIQLLVDRATKMANHYALNEACQLYWSIQGLQRYIPNLLSEDHNNENLETVFEQRAKLLPFAIVPQGLHWSQVIINSDNDQATTTSSDVIIDTLLQQIPFNRDILTTRTGSKVQERRGTAWIAKPGIGALAYSGKLMEPRPISDTVIDVMGRVEQRLLEEEYDGGEILNDYNFDDLANNNDNFFFDCVLCNHYADGQSACKYHTDPEHGSYWHRTTVVVAAGSCRKFAFKPIETNWDEWELRDESRNDNSNNAHSDAAILPLFEGDLVVMTENCNDDFYHAVHSSQNDDPRISLVLKRALQRGTSGDQRGHGLYGQGKRRNRGKIRKQQQSNDDSANNDDNRLKRTRQAGTTKTGANPQRRNRQPNRNHSSSTLSSKKKKRRAGPTPASTKSTRT